MNPDDLLLLVTLLLSCVAVVLVVASWSTPRLRKPAWIVWAVAMVLLVIGFSIY